MTDLKTDSKTCFLSTPVFTVQMLVILTFLNSSKPGTYTLIGCAPHTQSLLFWQHKQSESTKPSGEGRLLLFVLPKLPEPCIPGSSLRKATVTMEASSGSARNTALDRTCARLPVGRGSEPRLRVRGWGGVAERRTAPTRCLHCRAAQRQQEAI